MAEGRWVKVCHVDDLWEGDIGTFEIEEYEIAVVKLDGHIKAYYGVCPHALGREFYLDGDQLVCSAHLWTFDAKTGAGINPDCSGLLPFEVQIEEAEVYVKLPSLPAKEWLVNNLRYGLA